MIFLNKEKGVATILFDDKSSKVNVLTMDVMSSFMTMIEDVSNDSTIQLLIINSNKKNCFIAGADINEINDIHSYEDSLELVTKGQTIFNALENLKIPSVAAIDGVCLGGGLELALACSFRLATLSEKTQLGLPEVNLGIIPGFGGTQRLPRLIGLSAGLKMILSGKPISAKKAFKCGLVDKVCEPAFFDSELTNFSQSIMTSTSFRKKIKKRRLQRPLFEKLMASNFFTRFLMCVLVRKSVFSKTKGFYPAPFSAIKSVFYGYSRSIKKGLLKEAQEFSNCVITPVSSSLISLFFSQESAKKTKGVDHTSLKPKNVKLAGVLGAGLMGAGIAWIFSYRNIPVILKDIKNEAVLKGLKSIHNIYSQLKKICKVDDRAINQGMHRVYPTVNYDCFSNVDFVIEAVLENIDVKQAVYKELESVLDKHSIIASNTSSLCIDSLASNLKYPSRFIGMHFFSPVNRMPLVEIIPGTQTSDETLVTVVDMIKKMKKVPVIVKNCPGFLVNRVLLPYVNEAINCMIDGVSIKRVDRLMVEFGMPLGPFSLADEVGLDIGLNVLKVLENGYGKRMSVHSFFEGIIKDHGWLGKKSGCGFYNYKNKEKVINQKLGHALKDFQSSGINVISDEDIIDRLMLIIVNEAARCLEEEVVKDAATLDLAMIMGTGFPPFRGGICRYADHIGISNIIDKLEVLSRVYGTRFEPSKYLVELSTKKLSFY